MNFIKFKQLINFKNLNLVSKFLSNFLQHLNHFWFFKKILNKIGQFLKYFFTIFPELNFQNFYPLFLNKSSHCTFLKFFSIILITPQTHDIYYR